MADAFLGEWLALQAPPSTGSAPTPEEMKKLGELAGKKKAWLKEVRSLNQWTRSTPVWSRLLGVVLGAPGWPGSSRAGPGATSNAADAREGSL